MIKDITGRTFGRWKVLKYSHTDGENAFFLCECQCGVRKVQLGYVLRRGNSKSCGCYKKDRQTAQSALCRTNRPHYKKIDAVLRGMKNRCNNENFNQYKNYGERGISVCYDWSNKINGIESFYQWSLFNGYKEGLQIDRINNDGNYEPSNCRFVDAITNVRNSSIMKWHIINGKKYPKTDLLKLLRIGEKKLKTELNSGKTAQNIYDERFKI